MSKQEKKMSAASPLLQTLMNKAGIENNSQERQNWDELNEVYQDIADAIIGVGHSAQSTVRKIIDANNLPTVARSEVRLAFETLSSDIVKTTDDLLAIKSDHADKHGFVKNGDEVADALTAFERYVAIHERYQAVILPSLLTITEHAADSAEILKKKMLEEGDSFGATDVNVVTDVVVKEEVPAVQEVKEETNV